MTIKKVIRREIAALNMPRQVPQLISQARSIVLAMTGNVYLPTPFPTNVPSLATVTSDIDALEASEALALNKGIGAVEARDVKKEIVLRDMRALQAYVQNIADNDTDNALAIIDSAGMDIKESASRTKSDFSVSHGHVSGTVLLVAKAISRRASYEWQMGTDGQTWTNLPVTLACRTSVAGLTPGTIYYFRFRAVTKDGEGSWSQVVNIIVV